MQLGPEKIGTYAHYLSYATLVSFLANVGVELFQYLCGYIFRGFFCKKLVF